MTPEVQRARLRPTVKWFLVGVLLAVGGIMPHLVHRDTKPPNVEARPRGICLDGQAFVWRGSAWACTTAARFTRSNMIGGGP